VPASAANPANAVAHGNSIDPAGPLNRPLVDGEDHPFSRFQRHKLDPRLHPRALLGEDELAAGKVLRVAQEKSSLQREHPLAVQVLSGGNCSRLARNGGSEASGATGRRHDILQGTRHGSREKARRPLPFARHWRSGAADRRGRSEEIGPNQAAGIGNSDIRLARSHAWPSRPCSGRNDRHRRMT